MAPDNRTPNGPLASYLRSIGIGSYPALTSPFDPGYDLGTLVGHLEQSAHLMHTLKISMACWMIADEGVTRQKFRAASEHGVPSVTGGGPFEIAVAQGRLEGFLDLCADVGASRVEAGEGFTDTELTPGRIVAMAEERGLEVQFELGKKHAGSFTPDVVEELIEEGKRWLDAGAVQLVIEARESALGVGLFDGTGALDRHLADLFADAFTHDRLIFEAPDKPSQFALLNHFGPQVHLSNVRLEEILRVEIYRRGLHSDSFGQDRLRPSDPTAST